MGTESNQSSGNRNIPASQDDSWEEERQRTGLFRWDDPENLMPPWSVPPGLMVPGPRQPDADAQPADPGPQPADPRPRHTGAEPPADPGSWPGVAPPAGWFLHPAQSPPAAHQERTSAQEPPRRSAQPAIHPARPRSVPGPRRRDPPQRHRQSRAFRRIRTRRRTRAARHSHAPQPLAERARRALAHPRAGRILVLPADAEASSPAPGPDPGALRPRGRPWLPAHPFRPGRFPGSGRRRAGSFPVAALSPALDRGRYRVGAASGPAAALAPDRLTFGRTVGVCTPGPPAPAARATAAGAHAVARAGVTVARADTRAPT